MVKILIIHARRTGYGVINSLRKNSGVEFFAADTHITPTFYSKYLKNSFEIPEITKTEENTFIKVLIEIAEKVDYKASKPIVFTGKDDYLQFFSKNYKILGNYFKFSFEHNIEKLETALDKGILYEIARTVQVNVPKKIETSSDKNICFPVIIKPRIKNRPDIDVVQEGFRAKICTTIEELNQSVSILTSLSQPYIIQEYIPGNDDALFTIGTYSWKGELIAYSTSKKLREFPPAIGECAFGITTDTQEIVDPAKKLLKKIGLTGISQIEFKYYEGKYFLIEINPRLWSWHEIHRKAGVNFCKICIDAIQGHLPDETYAPNNEKSYSWHFTLMDLLHNNLLTKNISKTRVFIDFVRSDCKAYFCYNDLKPFWIHLKETIVYIKHKLREISS